MDVSIPHRIFLNSFDAKVSELFPYVSIPHRIFLNDALTKLKKT